MEDSEETRLAEKARSGDVVAYEKLVREHQDVAFRTACLITGDASEAEDAAQEAFVKAYRARKSLQLVARSTTHRRTRVVASAPDFEHRESVSSNSPKFVETTSSNTWN